MKSVRAFLEESALARKEVDGFLDPSQPNWACFDAELGYGLRSSVQHDGLDDAYTIARYAPSGERLTINFADRPCRINTYGDSFTQCHQVSDAETWQEYLAAHLGEPIRNFGVGGYGVYQAYRRMVRVEQSAMGAPYAILNIYGIDDHYRSVDAWRRLRIQQWFRHPRHRLMFHANPWVHVRLDPETGQARERPNPYPTPESLYRLCDPQRVYEAFRDDIVVQMYLAGQGCPDMDTAALGQLARTLGLEVDFAEPEQVAASARALHRAYALRASMYIVEQAQAFAQRMGKKLLILLSYADAHVAEACEGRPRPDQPFVDFLCERDIPFVDGLAKHVEDFAAFRLTPHEYTRRYYIGHYSPKGNHFFAFAIKSMVVDWLEPKPITYRQEDEPVDFAQYLGS